MKRVWQGASSKLYEQARRPEETAKATSGNTGSGDSAEGSGPVEADYEVVDEK